MFFLRALGTMTSGSAQTSAELGARPETDPEVVYDALEWVKKNRGVKVTILLESKPTPASARLQISKRLKGIATVKYCSYGCMNIGKTTTYPYAINHEKIITVSKTVWGNSDSNSGSDSSAVLSSSGNWARSQTRNYYQESVLVYGDKGYHNYMSSRFDAMLNCATTGCKSSSGFATTPVNWKQYLKKQRNIWVDTNASGHWTSTGRGTRVAFAPAPTSTLDYYVQQLKNVNCSKQDSVRVAMFRMTDEASKKIVAEMSRLKKAGCSVKVVLTSPVGGYSVSSLLKKKMSKAGIWLKCSVVPLHTKLMLIGSSKNNDAKIVTSTATMGVVSLTQSDEHTTIFDSSGSGVKPEYAQAIRRAYGTYAAGWNEIASMAKGC